MVVVGEVQEVRDRTGGEGVMNARPTNASANTAAARARMGKSADRAGRRAVLWVREGS